MNDGRFTRRSFLTGGLAVCGLASTGRLRAFAAAQDLRYQTTPFTLGVASGDPLPDSVVLWTRLAPDPLNGGGMPPRDVDVQWEIALDDKVSNVVRRGRATARPEWAHSVHVEVDGLLPERWYWYRFRVGNDLSPVGRTRTLPSAGANVDRLKFAFVSCQNYEIGHFTPYKHLANEDLGLVFHLGDYIYENAGSDRGIRPHVGPELWTLEQYRNRYAQYKTEPNLQAAHAAFPWVVTPDDHEVSNNYAGENSQRNDPVEVFLQRRAAAYQAYYEHMPLRRMSIPVNASIQLYRGFSYGTLARFFVLDTRQFRTNQPCEDGTKPLCREVFDEKATMLGEEQERWLFDGFKRSMARWNVIPQQVMIAPVDRGAGDERRFSMDQWAGYDAERTRVMQLLATRRLANPIVLTGDIHSNWVNDLKLDFLDEKSPVVGTELAGTSITSGGDGSDGPPETLPRLLTENPFVKFYNGQRGYVSCEVTAKTLRADYQIVEYVTRPDAPRITRASFVVEDGRPGAQRL